MSDLFLPPIPRGEMFIEGVMVKGWQDFFIDLYNRIGGVESLSTTDIVMGFISGYLRKTPPTPERNEESEFYIPSTPSDLDRIGDLEKELRLVQEPTPSGSSGLEVKDFLNYVSNKEGDNSLLEALIGSPSAVSFKLGPIQTGYTTFSNLSTDRTLDADATTVDELADVLGTLIEDLKAQKIIST